MNESWIKGNAVDFKDKKDDKKIVASDKLVSMPEKSLDIEKDIGENNEQKPINTEATQEVNIGDHIISEDKINDKEQDIKISECKPDTTINNEQKKDESEILKSMPDKPLNTKIYTVEHNQSVLEDKTINKMNIETRIIYDDKIVGNKQNAIIIQRMPFAPINNKQKNGPRNSNEKQPSLLHDELIKEIETKNNFTPNENGMSDPSFGNESNNTDNFKEDNKQEIQSNKTSPPPKVPNENAITAENKDQLQLAEAMKNRPRFITTFQCGVHKRRIVGKRLYHYFLVWVDEVIIDELLLFNEKEEVFQFELEDECGLFLVNLKRRTEIIGRGDKFKFVDLVIFSGLTHIASDFAGRAKLVEGQDLCIHYKRSDHLGESIFDWDPDKTGLKLEKYGWCALVLSENIIKSKKK